MNGNWDNKFITLMEIYIGDEVRKDPVYLQDAQTLKGSWVVHLLS